MTLLTALDVNLETMHLEEETNDMKELFARLAKSNFRSRFRLGKKERDYLEGRGFAVIEKHAGDIIYARLAPASPQNDGKQTPMRNHPVFIAQHATATCCRKCLAKWHGIEMGQELTARQVEYVVSVIMHWLRNT